jgi:hypothetical protein
MAQRLRAFLNRPVGEAPRRNVSPMALLKDKLEVLKRQNLDLSEQLAAAQVRDGSLFDLKLDTADDIVKTIIANCSANKAETIGKGLLAGIKRKQQRAAG